ncbi:hypothetical protein [Devosia sp.]|uniref:hypothetical protein n=1 Tax=Devosia sp. TaxID=1871048 RepID=UPI003265C955
MRTALSVLTIVLAAAVAMPAYAQTVEDYDTAKAALDESWNQLPLSFTNVRFVTEATGFGVYTEKADAIFKDGEPVTLYAEPLGFKFAKTDDDQNSFGFNFDFKLKNPAGDVLSEKPDFLKTEMKSHSENHEFYVMLTLNLKGAPAGDYVLEYTGHDLSSAETAEISVPFTLAAP